ncbi:MAG: 50S ribosomal protein P1 [Candidatus Thorarchaeota archaeon]|nr:50S ribosomal protein P1 [Candidatus Thorarchaeota archaeon]
MEYVYAALLLHKAGQEVSEKSIEAVLTAAGVKADKGRLKALLAALEGVNIDEALKSVAMPVAAPSSPGTPTAAAGSGAKSQKKEEEKEEKKEEEFTAGLGSLFG